MRLFRLTAGVITPLLLLSACAQEPMGPTVGVMPAPGKPFEAFQADQAVCKQFASDQVRGGAQRANNMQVGTALIGTLLGAGLGAAAGGGQGAAIGAGAGALGGTLVGAGPSQQSNYNLQQRYDLAYSQCMYTKGNQVPGYQPPPNYAPPPQGYPPQAYQSPSQAYPSPQSYQQPPQGYPPPPPGYPPQR